MFRKTIAAFLSVLMVCSVSASAAQSTGENAISENETLQVKTEDIATNLSKIDMSKWEYNTEDNVYYQIGISYCETPADSNYETLAIFIPGDYFLGTENGDGTYTCEINPDAAVNGYSAETAPIVMPIETPGYTAQAALTTYMSVTDYMNAGFVYVHAGCRGRDAGAPAGVTDLKAAIRYLRYTDDVTPGDAEKIFVFGMSGGGAQSAVVGSSGDSVLYEPYLAQIGAVQGVSDAVYGSMDWCPITNLDSADEAYEWMMGVTRSGLSEDEQTISDEMAAAFADYINNLGITDRNGNVLTLDESEEGIYQSGSYYDFIVSVIEESLNNFLNDTEFPYNASASTGKDGGPGGMGGFGKPDDHDFGDFRGPNGETDGVREFQGKGGKGDFGGKIGDTEDGNYEEKDNIIRTENSKGIAISGTYETVEDYIEALNENGTWVTYDAASNTASITGIKDFVTAFKNASKGIGAFDQLDCGQGENVLFGYDDGNGAHFDAVLTEILNNLGNDHASDYIADLKKTDELGYSAEQRLNMYTPLYYLLDSEEGYGTSTPAKYWRIRTGIAQSDTSLTTEVNLALALESCSEVEGVDFATVWGQGHEKAERTGNSKTNYIEWVNESMDLK